MARQSSEWLQLNVALARRDGAALPSARALLRDLEAVLSPSRQRKALPFFFQRKPPDLRLRLFGVRAKLMVRLRPVISRAKAEGHVVNSFYSAYEPEQRQFGGRECMQCVHAFWAADSLAWIMLDRLVEADAIGIPRATLIAAVMNDLFLRTLSDTAEVWDTWCNLEVLLQSGAGSAAPPAEAILLDSLIGSASDAEAAILVRYRQANAVLAEGLQRARRLGRMSCGIRSILPYIALFMLNRHGFDRTGSMPIARAMAAAWDPKQHLRGSQPDRIARAGGGRSSDRAGKIADPVRDIR